MKVLVLQGGVDIDSSIYNEPRSKYAQHPHIERDKRELASIKHAIDNNIPIVGICRGAQLLCAVHGGKLHQHTEPHTQNHAIITSDGQGFMGVPASHHQIMVPHGDYEVLAWNPSLVRIYNEDGTYREEANTPEVIYYPTLRHLAIQPHPEWCLASDPFVKYVNSLLYKFRIGFQF